MNDYFIIIYLFIACYRRLVQFMKFFLDFDLLEEDAHECVLRSGTFVCLYVYLITYLQHCGRACEPIRSLYWYFMNHLRADE